MKMDRSKELYREALQYMPGGVNSPVRAFKAVGGNPIFIRRGLGSAIFDEDKNAYIDYVMSWGAIMLGHCHPAICEACLLYTSDAADDLLCVDLGGRRIIKKKKK